MPRRGSATRREEKRKPWWITILFSLSLFKCQKGGAQYPPINKLEHSVYLLNTDKWREQTVKRQLNTRRITWRRTYEQHLHFHSNEASQTHWEDVFLFFFMLTLLLQVDREDYEHICHTWEGAAPPEQRGGPGSSWQFLAAVDEKVRSSCGSLPATSSLLLMLGVNKCLREFLSNITVDEYQMLWWTKEKNKPSISNY